MIDIYLSKCKHAFFWPDATTLDHNKILFHFAVVGKAAHWVDRFVCQVVFCRRVVFDQFSILSMETITNVVYLLVNLCTVMITLLSSTCNGKLDPGRMPCTNTGYFTKTLVRLTWQLLTMPSGSYT